MVEAEGRHWSGWWWSADSPQTRVPGTLRWESDGHNTLELIGGLNGTEFQGTILGEVDGRKPVSLWGVAERRSRSRGGQTLSQAWDVSAACVGQHLLSEDVEAFTKCTVHIDYLFYLTGDQRFLPPVWYAIDGVESPGEKQSDGSVARPYLLPVVGGPAEDIVAGEGAEMSYWVGTDVTTPWVSPATEKFPELKLDFLTERTASGPQITLRTKALAHFVPKRDGPLSASGVVEGLEPLEDYVTLALYAPAVSSHLRVATLTQDDALILTRSSAAAHESSARDLAPAFTFDTLDLSAFLVARERMTSTPQGLFAWRIFVGQIGHRPQTLEEDVSMALAAAEGTHRWCLGGGRNKDLAKRLKALHARLRPDIQGMLSLPTEKWAEWAAWARNHIDHGGAEAHNEIDLDMLGVLADTVRLVTFLAVLVELGLDVDAADLRATIVRNKGLHRLHWSCQSVAGLPDLTT